MLPFNALSRKFTPEIVLPNSASKVANWFIIDILLSIFINFMVSLANS